MIASLSNVALILVCFDTSMLMMFVLGGEKTVAGVWDEETLLVSPTVRR
jgi:hypothetical protein